MKRVNIKLLAMLLMMYAVLASIVPLAAPTITTQPVVSVFLTTDSATIIATTKQLATLTTATTPTIKTAKTVETAKTTMTTTTAKTITVTATPQAEIETESAQTEIVTSISNSDLLSATTTFQPLSPLCQDDVPLNGHDKYNNTIAYLDGQIIVTVLTIEPSAALLIAKRINEIGFIGNNITFGVRIIEIKNFDELKSMVLEEMQWQIDCAGHTLGFLVSKQLLTHVQPLLEDLQYDYHILPSEESILFTNVAHLLYEMPWHSQNISLDIRAQSLDVYNEFMEAARLKHLCPKNGPAEQSIYIVIGNQMLDTINGTIISVPRNGEMTFVTDLPDQSYLLVEQEIDINYWLHNITAMHSATRGLVPSNVVSTASIFYKLSKFLISTIKMHCVDVTRSYDLGNCSEDFLTGFDQWTDSYAAPTTAEIFTQLKLNGLSMQMNYNMIQKRRVKFNVSDEYLELRPIASLNILTNVTTFYHYHQNASHNRSGNASKLGILFHCAEITVNKHEHDSRERDDVEYSENAMYWRVIPEAWVAAGLTISILGILTSLAILIFIIVRICLEDVLEGNPIGSILLLISLILLFGSFLPFSVEYSTDFHALKMTSSIVETWNNLCAIKVFILTMCYCFTFSLLLCRAIMLASIGSEGGFLSHVNGYIQSVICGFSFLVQVGLSTQLLLVMHAAHQTITCERIFNGNWLWALLSYDGMLLGLLVLLGPLMVRSQRNYREGVLLFTGGILCIIVWGTWIPLAMLGERWRAAAIPLGAQATGWAILSGILIPRCFLIVRGIARSDLAQALPSLTTLAFAHNTQYCSEQSIYECVNPAMRQRQNPDEIFMDHDRYLSPNEIPTLPLRTPRTGQNYQPYSVEPNDHAIMPASSPSKVTRF